MLSLLHLNKFKNNTEWWDKYLEVLDQVFKELRKKTKNKLKN